MITHNAVQSLFLVTMNIQNLCLQLSSSSSEATIETLKSLGERSKRSDGAAEIYEFGKTGIKLTFIKY